MNFKRFHESKNLFDPNSTRYHMGKGTNNLIAPFGNGAMFYIEAESNMTYTIKVHTTDSTFVRLYLSNAPIVENVVKSYNVISESENIMNPEVTISNTDYAYLWIQIGGTWYTEHGGSSIMLNTGSQPLPYEPYSSEVWHDIPYYLHKTDTDIITTLPADLYADGTNATVGLAGNMYQASGVSPTNPIQPSECGERTGNLFDISQVVTNTQVINQGSSLKVMIPPTTTGVNAAMPNTLQDYCPTLNVGDEVTLSFKTTGSSKFIYLSGENIAWGSGQSKTITATMLSSAVTWYASGRDTEAVISNIMLNLGSTALPYEPYGVKIPISSASTTTPIYLGEVQTTRKIKKLVLTGDENWSQSGTVSNTFYTVISGYLRQRGVIIDICSHYTSQANINGAAEMQDGNVSFYANAGQPWEYFYVRDSNFATAADFKSYLAAQYAAGTPVTVWYVLANETTGIVNEPLRKIGDYADEVSGITIPTIAGANTIDVDTTLKPSEVSVNYHGWHPVSAVRERINGAWA